jgi:acyl-CoA synthetase (AMP-forming)/AMP-acid ligase II
MWTFPEVRTLGDTPRYHARHHPEAPALAFAGAFVTHGALDTHSTQVANALLARGYGAGARIGYLGRNAPELAYLLYGTAKAGHAFLPLNWRLAPREIALLIADSGCLLLFVDEDVVELANDALAVLDMPPEVVRFRGGAEPRCGGFAEHASTQDPRLYVASDATALIVYTSGTTGLPKGVAHSHESFNYIRLIEHLEPETDWGLGDTFLMVMPSFHLAGLGWMIQSLYTGMCVSMLPIFEPERVLAAIRDTRPSIVMMVPTMLQMVLDHPLAEEVDFSCIRLLAYAGSPMPFPLIKRALQRTGCRFLNCYGATETLSTAIWLRPSQHDLDDEQRLRSIGTPATLVEVRLLDAEGADVADGAVGEIVIRIPSVFKGYWQQAEQTAAVLRDGWYWTGDSAYRDPDGFYYLRDRMKDMIISGGENIYPSEIEQVLIEHEGVRDVAVIGVSDPRWGESARALLIAEPGHALVETELIAFCRARIAGYKVPKTFAVVDDFPRTPSGKIQKAVLRALHETGRAG